MIRRALELRQALSEYQRKLKASKDEFDAETFKHDCLSDDDWEILEIIRD